MPTSDRIARLLGSTDVESGITHAAAGYHVYVRDSRFQRLGELTDWSSLHLVMRFNGVGTWSLETSADSEGAQLLTKKGGIIVTREVDGTEFTIFSGSVSTAWSWTPTTFSAGGLSDDTLLDAPCRPTPSQSSGPFVDEYQVITDQASTVMVQLIATQIGISPFPWAQPINMDPDPHLGGTLTARARFQSLISLLREIAATPIAGGLGFRVFQSDVQSSVLRAQVYQPQDRSSDVVFSIDLGTVADYSDEWQAPDGNYFYVLGGDGFGTNRTVSEAGDTSSYNEVGRYIPKVIDDRGSTDTGELEQALAEALASAVSRRRVSIVPFDVPSLQYGRDYGLGDLVTVVTRSGSMVDLIREIEMVLDKEKGVVVIPTVGGLGSDGDDPMVAQITSTQDRLSNLERNWGVPPDSVDRSMLVAALKPPIGEVKWLSGLFVPTGYLLADGQEVSRTTYALLYAELGAGASPWGLGNGSTTFNVPDLIDRMAIGANGLYPLGSYGGAVGATVAGVAHTHPGHHSHTVPDHLHPVPDHGHTIPDHNHTINDHSHTIPDHQHTIGGHTHTVDIDHDHPSFNSGLANGTGVVLSTYPSAVTNVDHRHPIDVPALGTTNKTTGGQTGGTATNDKTGLQTNDKTGMVTNDKTGLQTDNKTGLSTSNKTGLSTNDDTATAPAASYTATASVSTLSPYAALIPVIWTGLAA